MLDGDGATVKETFPLSYYTVKSGLPVLERYWEFVRRYMEEGPRTLRTASNSSCQWPIAGEHRQWVSPNACGAWWELHHDGDWRSAGAHARSGRWIAMQTSKVPKWPQEIGRALPYRTRRSWVRDATTVTPPN